MWSRDGVQAVVAPAPLRRASPACLREPVNSGVRRSVRSMLTRSFQAELLSGHKENAAQVPFDPGAAWSLAAQVLWPGLRGFPVLATLNGVTFDGAIVARSRKFWPLVPTAISESAKVNRPGI